MEVCVCVCVSAWWFCCPCLESPCDCAIWAGPGWFKMASDTFGDWLTLVPLSFRSHSQEASLGSFVWWAQGSQKLQGNLRPSLKIHMSPLVSHSVGQGKSQGQPKFMGWGSRHRDLCLKRWEGLSLSSLQTVY